MATNRIVFASIPDRDSSVVQAMISDAQALEQEGRHSDARSLYERALALLRPGDGLRASDLARWIARTHGSDGDVEAGIECAELAFTIAEAHGCERAVAQALNVLGILHQSRGGLDEATFVYRRAESHAKAAGEVQLVAMVQLNLGTIANIRGDFEAALANYEACLAGFRATGSDAFVSYVLNNMGLLYGDLDRREEAEKVLREAHQTAAKRDDKATQAMVLVNLADLCVTSGRIDEAEQACRDARSLLSDYEGAYLPGEWNKVMGVVQRERGRLAEADRHLQDAFGSALERDDLLLMAEVMREQAILFSQQDRNQETLRCLNRSHQLFRQLRARKDIADLERQLDELEQTFLAIVRRWGESIEAADRYTQGHCVRVAEYACALAEAIGMDRETLLWFRMGALLHDVGKIIVPAEVLNKPGGFTPEERLLMERHPDAGVELLEGIEFPWDIRPMVRFHHERWAGGGYPLGIAGEEIPVSARILTIADVFDALSTDRPYRKALPVEQCLDIMCNPMKGCFEPELLEVFVELCRTGRVTPPDQRAEGGDGPGGPRSDRVLLLSATPQPQLLDSVAELLGTEFQCSVVPSCDDLVMERGGRDFVAAVVEVGGPDAAAQLRRACGLLRGLPVVAVVDGNESLALQLIQAGAQECLTRASLRPEILVHHVWRAIERKRLESEIEQASIRDDLTGLYNRRGFHSLATRRVNALPADAMRPVLVFADLDGLKPINDLLGHSEGDRALMEAAGVFRACFRGIDIIARLGGDEFVALAFPADHDISGTQLLQRIQDEVATRNAAPDRRFLLSISAGYAVCAADDSLEDVIARADQSMYRRKRERKPRLRLVDESPLSVAS